MFQDVNPLQLISDVGIANLATNLLIGIVYFFSFGYLMRVVYSHHYKQSITWTDTFLLPFMMHLWTYILPAKGGLIYQTFFVKAKYQIDMSKGFSVGVLVFAAAEPHPLPDASVVPGLCSSS